MKQFVPQNLSAIVAYEEWMDNKKLGKYDLNKDGAVRDRDFHARWRTQLNGKTCQRRTSRGLQSPDSTTTVKKEILVKKDIHSSRKIAALLSISQPDGNLPKIPNQSILPTKKGLDG